MDIAGRDSEIAFIVDGFPQDNGEHLMDIYATTNPDDSGYYWENSVWHFDDMKSDEDREILVIPRGQACQQLTPSQSCKLTIDLNVTGMDMYSIILSTKYVPELCQKCDFDCACGNMEWNDPQKRCCLHEAYYNDKTSIMTECVSALEEQARTNPYGVVGSDTDCYSSAPEKTRPISSAGKTAGISMGFGVLALLLTVCVIRVIKISENRKRLIAMFQDKISNDKGKSLSDSDFTEQLLADSKLESSFGGILPSTLNFATNADQVQVHVLNHNHNSLYNDEEENSQSTKMESDGSDIEMK
ncbi:hypothetical protein TL16_g03532 [Triparma laevis f. inornata]|uniref:Uncharacterized protein n=1 Tax=Triparma laevis f. inornata TaxID=1714386 RepID=A0A9W7E524_9STRA|nr:hypothetical protein TL16_g03532 [Triparma laevis f. inornata]